MFKIEADFDLSDLETIVNGNLNDWFDDLSSHLLTVGKGLVDKARAKTAAEQGFNNITWNLRSSIGCAVVRNHGIADKDIYFPPIGKGEKGHETGMSYLREIALLIDDGDIYLLFGAGMDYASLVQAKGKDVIKHVIGDNLGTALKSIM